MTLRKMWKQLMLNIKMKTTISSLDLQNRLEAIVL